MILPLRSNRKMIFMGFTILFCLLHRVNPQELNDVVKSALEYYRSRSVVLILDESRMGIFLTEFSRLAVVSKDSFTFITLQKRLSSGKNFYFSATKTLSSFPGSVKMIRQSLRETVVVWNPTDSFPMILEKVYNETDITTPRWFLMTSTLTPEAFDNVTIPLNREFTIAYGNSESGYSLAEVYDFRPGRKLMNALGRWSVDLQPSTDIFKRRGDFRGNALKVMSPKRDACDGTSFAVVIATVVWCIHQKLWIMIEEMLNTKTELLVVPHLNVESIPRSNADVSFRSANLDAVDMNTRDYVWPTFMAKVEIVTRYIKQEVAWETYILPFREQMWTVIFIWIILWDVILASVQFIILRKKTEKSFLRCCREFSFTTFFTFSSQGVSVPSRLSSVRIMFLTMFIVPAVLYPGYSAVLTSFLTVQQHKQPYQSLEEMSRTNEYKLGWHNTFALEYLFNVKNMTPLNEALLRNNILPQDELPSTDAEGIKRMCNDKFSYFTVMYTVLALKPKCKYYTFKQHFKLVFASIELKKNSWYKYFLDRCERTLAFTGVKYRLETQVVMKDTLFSPNKIIDKSEVPPIKLNNTVFPCAVLLFGLIASALLLLLEVVCFRHNSTQTDIPLVPAGQHKLYDFVL